jgi:hypothetical protein
MYDSGCFRVKKSGGGGCVKILVKLNWKFLSQGLETRILKKLPFL